MPAKLVDMRYEMEKRKEKLIPVKVIKQAADNATVEFTLNKLLQRAVIPAGFIENGKVPEDVLEAGIPYGIDWENVKLSASSIELANMLRRLGIWTYEDAMRNPNRIVSVLQTVYKIDLAALLAFARENK